MFDFIRQHNKALMIVLFLLIVPSFVVVGVLDRYSGSRDKSEAVASIAGESIRRPEWQALLAYDLLAHRDDARFERAVLFAPAIAPHRRTRLVLALKFLGERVIPSLSREDFRARASLIQAGSRASNLRTFVLFPVIVVGAMLFAPGGGNQPRAGAARLWPMRRS